MKKKLLTMFSIAFVLAFAAMVYAFNQAGVSAKATVSGCAKSDSCPLKNKNAAQAENNAKTSCCDNENCCCKNGSCPMKAKDKNASSSENCCDSCCGNSCPMKNKEAQATLTKTSGETAANAETCQHKKAGI